MKTPEEIQEALQDARLEDVAAETGLSYFTLVRYRAGNFKRPSHDTVSRLSEWMEGQAKTDRP